MVCPLPFLWSSQSQEEQAGKPVPSSYEQLQGTWEGILQMMGTDYIVRISVPEYVPGKPYTGMLAVPQQVGGPMEVVISLDEQNAEAAFVCEALQVGYEAVLQVDGNALTGTWKQWGMEIPLEMKPVQIENLMHIPRQQDPEEPYPYHADEVTFLNAGDGVELAGTFTYPKEGGPFPAVVLVTGSGAHNRDQELFGHRPFKVLADHLTRSGIAVLRYDDRGAGASGGDPAMCTSWDLSKDTEAALDYLLTSELVDRSAVGILGLSEGGIIGPMVADRREEVGFLVLMAAPGVPGDQLLITQSKAIMTAQGVPEQMIDANLAVNRSVYDLLLSPMEGEQLKEELRKAFKQTGLPEKEIEFQIEMLSLPWMRYFISYDPSRILSRMRIPVLVLQGERDTQVVAQENADAIKKALEEAGNTQYRAVIYPELNHVFQPAVTGLPSEYGTIETTMDSNVMDDISRWILKTAESER